MTEIPTDAESFKRVNKNVIAEFRANAGIVGGLLAGKDVLLLTTTGLRSGKPRVSPLFYFTINEKVVIVGSYRGADTDPLWVRNLRANPRAHIEVGTTDYDVIARELPAAERDEIYPRIVAIAPNYGEYEANTSRVIPLFELLRVMFCPGAGEPRIEVIEPRSKQEHWCTE